MPPPDVVELSIQQARELHLLTEHDILQSELPERQQPYVVKIHWADLRRHGDLLRLIYTNDRFATGENNAAVYARILTILREYDIEPIEYERRVARYCGNHYLLPNAERATLAECRKKGYRHGDKHGSLTATTRSR